jgi:quercetin dioxygenase-like cupin family protein
MANRFKLVLPVAALGALAIASASALATPSSGLTSERLGSVVIDGRIDMNRAGIRLKTNKPVEVFTQKLTFAPGGTSGWHHHPGANFVSVVEGTLTYYDDKCTRRTYPAGSGFSHSNRDVHIARNESSSNVVVFVTYVKPAPMPRLPNSVDEPAPAGCAVR